MCLSRCPRQTQGASQEGQVSIPVLANVLARNHYPTALIAKPFGLNSCFGECAYRSSDLTKLLTLAHAICASSRMATSIGASIREYRRPNDSLRFVKDRARGLPRQTLGSTLSVAARPFVERNRSTRSSFRSIRQISSSF